MHLGHHVLLTAWGALRSKRMGICLFEATYSSGAFFPTRDSTTGLEARQLSSDSALAAAAEVKRQASNPNRAISTTLTGKG